MQRSQRSNGSWMPDSVVEAAPIVYDGPDFGWSLFQLIVQNIDNRIGAKTGDLVATLAFVAGRVVQRATFRESPQSFRFDVSASGMSFLRSDIVTDKLGSLTPGTLASTLVEASMFAGARRFPEIVLVKHEAQEAMQRRGGAVLRGHDLSAHPRALAQQVQDDVDGLLFDAADRHALVRSSIRACGHALGYQRSRLCPAEAAELALSVALYGGWLDQRESLRH